MMGWVAFIGSYETGKMIMVAATPKVKAAKEISIEWGIKS